MAWVASLGVWADCVPKVRPDEQRATAWTEAESYDEPWTTDYVVNPLIGPFDTKREAVEWLRAHSMALGSDDDHDELNEARLPGAAYEFYVMELDAPSSVTTFQLGDEPGQLSVETAVGIVSDELDRRRRPAAGL